MLRHYAAPSPISLFRSCPGVTMPVARSHYVGQDRVVEDDALQDDEAAARARQRDLVRRGYDAISLAYRSDHSEPDGSTAEAPSRYAGWVADLARLLPPGAQVVDLGCGAGIPATRELSDRGLRVIGADFSAVQLRRARRLVPVRAWCKLT